MQQYSQPSDLPARIPVFPLRGAILLPRANVPLRIFEPRYLAMVDDVMAGHRLIGIIQPKFEIGSDIDEESPLSDLIKIQEIGCVGRVTAYQELDIEHLMITMTGVTRFKVLGEVETEKPYRIVSADYQNFASDFMLGLGESAVDREKLLSVLKDFLDANKLAADWQQIGRASSEQLVNALSVLSPFGPEEKQALLEAATLSDRAQVLIALAEMDLAAGTSDGGTTLQ